MSRYIDADELIVIGLDDPDCEHQFKFVPWEFIEDAPTADVVEVVRCKDCKHQRKHFHADARRKDGGYFIYWCDLDDGYSHVCLDGDFCSKGERREDAT